MLFSDFRDYFVLGNIYVGQPLVVSCVSVQGTPCIPSAHNHLRRSVTNLTHMSSLSVFTYVCRLLLSLLDAPNPHLRTSANIL